jgi:hypothetical protein
VPFFVVSEGNKTMIVSGRIENFAEYSQFKSLKDFNNNIEMFLAVHKKDFTKSELIAFKRLVRYAAKFSGVANAKIGTLLKAINDKLNGFGVSRSTFERMLRKAKDLGILTIKNTVKRKGGKGHNVYVFNRIDVLKQEKMTHRNTRETSTGSKRQEGNSKSETIYLSEPSKKDKFKKRIENDSLDHTFVSDYVPKEFSKLVKCYFDEATIIEEYWRMAKISHYDYRTIFNEETLLQVAIHSFKQLIGKLKKSKIHNPIAYFTGTIKNKLFSLHWELIEEEKTA